MGLCYKKNESTVDSFHASTILPTAMRMPTMAGNEKLPILLSRCEIEQKRTGFEPQKSAPFFYGQTSDDVLIRV